jgi:hypothetical protein
MINKIRNFINVHTKTLKRHFSEKRGKLRIANDHIKRPNWKCCRLDFIEPVHGR